MPDHSPEHSRYHHERQALLESHLPQLRQRLRVPERWRIRIKLCCEDEMPEAYGYARWNYLQNRDYTILMVCGLSDEQATYILAHELLEIALSDYAEFAISQINERPEGELRDEVHRTHAHVRNEVIEWFIPLLFGFERPLSFAPEG